MDPKTANLDPKLQAAYDRVMGTAMPQTASTAPQPVQTTQQTPSQTAPQTVPATSVAAQPETSSPQPLVTPPMPQAPQPSQTPVTPMEMTAAKPEIAKAPQPMASGVHTIASSGFVAQGDGQTKKKSFISTPILFMAAVVFFVIYALFWMRFFNVKIPFLPQ